MEQQKIVFWSRSPMPQQQLSNFYHAPIELKGIAYKSVEHFYQAAKCHFVRDREMIKNLPTARDTRIAAHKVKVRPNWREIQLPAMRAALRAKFTQHPELRAYLLSTAGCELIHYSGWEQWSFWGIGKQGGENTLGKMLMELREELLQEEQS